MARVKLVIAFAVVLCFTVVNCKEDDSGKEIEQARTFVHHAMKRMAILLPAFIFKLGVMFTMLMVTAITSTKGLMVGTLLLALGVGHFIASKFGGSAVIAAPPATHAHITLPVPHHYAAAHHYEAAPAGWHAHHLVDRSDSVSPQTAAYAQNQAYAQSQAYGAWKQ